MNTIVWLLALALLGLATGKLIGMGLAFTGGRTSYDLVAGILGALVLAIPLRLSHLTGYSAALPTLIIGVSAAMLSTWLTRIVTWKADPVIRLEKESAPEGRVHLSQDLMTTAEGTRMLMRGGRLVEPRGSDAVTETVVPGRV